MGSGLTVLEVGTRETLDVVGITVNLDIFARILIFVYFRLY